jgi:hypothetical protein
MREHPSGSVRGASGAASFRGAASTGGVSVSFEQPCALKAIPTQNSAIARRIRFEV